MNVVEQTIRIMLIDDHQTMLWGLEKLIQGEEPRMKVVAMATNSKEALEQIDKSVPNVILLDLDLGGENGLDIIPALLSNSVSRVLVLTGDREPATLDAAVLRGARGVMRKDASADQVLKAIEKVHRGELWLDHETLGRVFGRLMQPADAREPDPETERNAMLTSRERKIIHTIVEENGASNKVIAQKLFISEHTLRNHLTSIYQKLGVSNRLELYVYATRHKLGAPSSGLPANKTERTSRFNLDRAC